MNNNIVSELINRDGKTITECLAPLMPLIIEQYRLVDEALQAGTKDE